MFEELIKKAERYGITRAMLGREMYGKSQYSRIYLITNPTQKTLEKLKTALEKLKEESGK